MGIAKVRLVLRKDAPTKEGLCAVLLAVSLSGTTVRIQTGVSVLPPDWDAAKMQVRKGATNAAEYNRILGKLVGKANEVLIDFLRMGRPPTPAQFKEALNNDYDRSNFLEFLSSQIANNKARGVIADGTWKVEDLARRELFAFAQSEMRTTVISFADMNQEIFVRFDKWMAMKQKRKGTKGTAPRRKMMNVLKKYLRLARSMGLRIPPVVQGIVVKDVPALPTFLTAAEVERLAELEASGKVTGTRLMVLRGFLFMCFTGLRYSDLVSLRWEHIKGEEIVIQPTKTKRTSGKVALIPLLPQVERYMAPRTEKIPVPYLSDQKSNAHLKWIAEAANIKKRLTNHVARHTFATQCMERNVPIPYIRSMLGHSTDTMINRYLSMTDQGTRDHMKAAFEDWEVVKEDALTAPLQP